MLQREKEERGADKTVAAEGEGENRKKEEEGSTLMMYKKPVRGAYCFIGLLKYTYIYPHMHVYSSDVVIQRGVIVSPRVTD